MLAILREYAHDLDFLDADTSDEQANPLEAQPSSAQPQNKVSMAPTPITANATSASTGGTRPQQGKDPTDAQTSQLSGTRLSESMLDSDSD